MWKVGWGRGCALLLFGAMVSLSSGREKKKNKKIAETLQLFSRSTVTRRWTQEEEEEG